MSLKISKIFAISLISESLRSLPSNKAPLVSDF